VETFSLHFPWPNRWSYNLDCRLFRIFIKFQTTNLPQILEYTPEDHADRANLEEALSKAEELCAQVNEGVREEENSDRLEWLQNHVICEGFEERLIFNSLTNSLGPRKFLHYGVLKKVQFTIL